LLYFLGFPRIWVWMSRKILGFPKLNHNPPTVKYYTITYGFKHTSWLLKHFISLQNLSVTLSKPSDMTCNLLLTAYGSDCIPYAFEFTKYNFQNAILYDVELTTYRFSCTLRGFNFLRKLSIYLMFLPNSLYDFQIIPYDI
jgi:hypothetical protein